MVGETRKSMVTSLKIEFYKFEESFSVKSVRLAGLAGNNSGVNSFATSFNLNLDSAILKSLLFLATKNTLYVNRMESFISRIYSIFQSLIVVVNIV